MGEPPLGAQRLDGFCARNRRGRRVFGGRHILFARSYHEGRLATGRSRRGDPGFPLLSDLLVCRPSLLLLKAAVHHNVGLPRDRQRLPSTDSADEARNAHDSRPNTVGHCGRHTRGHLTCGNLCTCY